MQAKMINKMGCFVTKDRFAEIWADENIIYKTEVITTLKSGEVFHQCFFGDEFVEGQFMNDAESCARIIAHALRWRYESKDSEVIE